MVYRPDLNEKDTFIEDDLIDLLALHFSIKVSWNQ